MEKDKNIILVLEDERPLLDAIRIKLENCGFEPLTCRSVEQAQNYLDDKDIKISVVWLDHYLLGKETGLDFVAKLKSDSKWKDVPIFVVSNTASQDKVHSYLGLGVNKYYTKSDYKLEQIITDIKAVLDSACENK
jgi:DNA-binding response OmpR family regulator